MRTAPHDIVYMMEARYALSGTFLFRAAVFHNCANVGSVVSVGSIG